MSSVFSLIISGRVNSVEPFGDAYKLSITHLDSYNNFRFDLVTNGRIAPPREGEYVIVMDAVPLNSTNTPDGYVHDQRMVSTSRTRLLPTTKDTVVNSVIISGRLGADAVTRSGQKSNGDTYKQTKFNVLANYWNGQSEDAFSLQTTYWKAELKGLHKGNGVVVSGQLTSQLNPNDGQHYFNLTAFNFDYGATSKNNLAAA